MLNKASRQEARPIKLDPKFLIQEVVGKNVAILGQVRFTHDGKSMQVAQWPKGFKS